jgi:seryl-tRNA synthetase
MLATSQGADMHDIRAIRDNPGHFQKAWSRRSGGVHLIDGQPVTDTILALDAEVRKAITEKEHAEAARNAKSKEIGKAKAAKDETLAAQLMADVAKAKETIEAVGKKEAEAIAKRDDLLARLPNLPMDDVPDGADEHSNREVRKVGTPRAFNFKPKDHADLGEALKMMDFEAAARMSGARFVVLKKHLARLERALTQFMLDLQTGENGY